MRIDTEIKELFPAKTGTEMVRFTASKGAGQLWAAPAHLVRQGLGTEQLLPGQRLEIEIEDNRVANVRPVTSAGSHAGRNSRPRHSDRAPRPNLQDAARHGALATTETIIPYGFVPIEPAHAVADKPVLHDGSGIGESGGGELLSGEILCSFETLTPLLPGNGRYPVEEADQEQLRQWGFDLPDKNKQIAEPLRLNGGRVVISGSSLKGMLRASLSALLSAPMEQVKERHFTYRPNLNPRDDSDKYVVRPAVIKAAKNGGWDIEVFGGARDADAIFRKHEYKSHYKLVPYKGGIDGDGLLAAAFGKSNGIKTGTYNQAQVPPKPLCTLHIPASLYQRYLKDQEVVLANDTEGHLTAIRWRSISLLTRSRRRS